MVFQSYALFPNMTVADNIGFGLRVRKRPKDQIRKRVGELLELINLPDKGERYPYQLSGGQQQRVALARALAIEPEVLLLDEPLSALDAKIRVALRKEIRAIQRQLGITTVYVTHDQEEAMSLSDRVVVMSEGRIEQIGPPPEIYNFPATPFVASFVGTLNLLPATVVEAATARVSIGDQEIRGAAPIAGERRVARHGRGPAGGRRARRGRRAEPPPRDHRGRLFLGSIVRTRLKLTDDASLSWDQFNDPALAAAAIGESATVSFPPEASLVLEGAASADKVIEQAIAEA